MLKIKCPKCGSTNIQRSNVDVVVYESIQVTQDVDYVVEGGEERRVTSLRIRSDESKPPYIEELDSDDLEFSCQDCSFFFEGIKDDDAMLEFAQDNDLIIGFAERRDD